jgi:hypothetical protein
VLDRVRVELLRRIGRCGSRNRRVPPPPPRFLDKVSETLEIGPDFGFGVGGFLRGVGCFGGGFCQVERDGLRRWWGADL